MNNEPFNPEENPNPTPGLTSQQSDFSAGAAPQGYSGDLPQPQSPAPKKPKKLKLVAIAAAVAVVVLGGGSALAYNFWYQNPDKVVGDAVVSLLKADTVKTEGKMTTSSGGSTAQVDFVALVDSANGSGNIDIDVKGMKVDGVEDMDFSISGLYADNILFGRFNNVSDIISMVLQGNALPTDSDAFSKMADNLDSKWVRLSEPESDGSELSEDMTCMTNAFSKLEASAVSREIRELYLDSKFIVIKEQLDPKTINGVMSLGYQIDSDPETEKRFVEGLNNTTLGKELIKCNDGEKFDADDIYENDSEDESKAPEVTVWISRFGHELQRIEMAGEGTSLNADFTYDIDVSVEAPSESVTIDELMEQFQEAMIDYYLEQSGYDSSLFAPEFDSASTI